MPAREVGDSIERPESVDAMESPENACDAEKKLRPYQPPAVKVFPVADLVRSGGGSATDAFGQGHF
jgi:hypothetical protein